MIAIQDYPMSKEEAAFQAEPHSVSHGKSNDRELFEDYKERFAIEHSGYNDSLKSHELSQEKFRKTEAYDILILQEKIMDLSKSFEKAAREISMGFMSLFKVKIETDLWEQEKRYNQDKIFDPQPIN